jgi:hypothetical protein
MRSNTLLIPAVEDNTLQSVLQRPFARPMSPCRNFPELRDQAAAITLRAPP